MYPFFEQIHFLIKKRSNNVGFRFKYWLILTGLHFPEALAPRSTIRENRSALAYPDVATASWPLGTATGVGWERRKCPCWCCWWVEGLVFLNESRRFGVGQAGVWGSRWFGKRREGKWIAMLLSTSPSLLVQQVREGSWQPLTELGSSAITS